MPIKSHALFAGAVLLLAAAQPVQAAAPLEAGVWVTVSTFNNMQTMMRLTLTGSAGSLSGQLRYGAPLNCTLRLTQAGEYVFSLSSSGGYCDLYQHGMAHVEVGAAKSVGLSLSDSRGRTTRFLLRPAGMP